MKILLGAQNKIECKICIIVSFVSFCALRVWMSE